ncbi:hypothetical protein [Synechococcus elongatus]|uniref:hypothetical protein n=1 Tax=Synechococcus elongatus TaxID=32046 RepID=UPI0030CAF62A
MTKERAIVEDNNMVGGQRRDIYKAVIEHADKACQAGFYLEAITLYESLISDRLESRIVFLDSSVSAFRSLGENISKLEKLESDEELKAILSGQLRNWKNHRNQSLHELAKIEKYDPRDWDQKVIDLPDIAAEGKALFRLIDACVRRLKKA